MPAIQPHLWVPSVVFFTRGVGVHETHRVAMQRAMEEAGVAECNMIKISSVIAPGCRIVTREQGIRLLRPGAIVHAVIASGDTSEPHQRVTSAVCWAQPENPELPGFVTEIEEEEAKGKSEKTATDEAGEALLTIMAEKLEAKVDAKKLWAKRGRGRTVRIAGERIRVGSMTATAVGPEGSSPQITVALVMAVFL